jgi:short-subunit dehydrogenase
MSFANKNIWLIGASSGIGRALAVELGQRGARLALSARSEQALETLGEQVGKGAIIEPLDVTDGAAFGAAARSVAQKLGSVDSVILMSGIYTPGSVIEHDAATVKNIIDVNVGGALNCIAAVLPLLRVQKKSQLAFCGSVAGYRGLPHAQPYSLTKAALINLAESLCAEEKKNGIDVRLINPGFVKTPMTDKNKFSMPFMITPEEAAKRIADGLAGSSFEIHFPKRLTLLMKLLKILPDWLYFKIAGAL